MKLTDVFISKFGDQKVDKSIKIGVFNSWRNPREFYTEERINAMVHEASKQDAVLYFFTSDDIDIDFDCSCIWHPTFRELVEF